MKPSKALLFIKSLLLIFPLFGMVWSAELLTLKSKHYRMHYEKKHAQLAGQVLEYAEIIWPTLAKAYNSYDSYTTINIFIQDKSDAANGYAIPAFNKVVFWAPHINWVMRGRANWVGNVVTHEIAHIFSMRRMAWASPVSAVYVGGGTYTAYRLQNYSFSYAWIPLVAPSWYVEGIAQLEAEYHGYDTWDSQRDMIVRDAFLTNSLPTLGEIETFDGDWVAGERVYNTGFAFLRHLRDKYGMDKIRELAVCKPAFNFGAAFSKIMGKPLSGAYEDWKKSLSVKYESFQFNSPASLLADSGPFNSGSFNQNLVYSSDGRYRAWLGNHDREFPINWVYWEDLSQGKTAKSSGPINKTTKAQSPKMVSASLDRFSTGAQPFFPGNSMTPVSRLRALLQNHGIAEKKTRQADRAGRSDDFGSTGLQFNKDNTRLLTTRRAEYSPFGDIWEYEFKADKWHRLTWMERASQASYNPAGKEIVYVRQEKGSCNLAILQPGGQIRQLTNFREGQQIYSPVYNPKGDSIFFVLGKKEKEAIVRIPSNAPEFNPFKAFKDSAVFPDSLLLAREQKLAFLTGFHRASFKNLRFFGDTLCWASNIKNNVFNIYLRLPGDSTAYLATQAKGQALEPLIRDGYLYYQGYRKQAFKFFRQPLQLEKSQLKITSADSLSTERPGKKAYSKMAETGKYTGKTMAWDFTPYLSVSPLFLDDTTDIVHISAGLSAGIGDLTGYISQYVDASVGKQTDYNTPLNYSFSYYGALSYPSISRTRHSWRPQINYSLSRSVIQHPSLSIEDAIFTDGIDSVYGQSRLNEDITYTMDYVSASLPLPFNISLDARYFQQALSIDWEYNITYTYLTRDSVEKETERGQSYQNAPFHRHFAPRLSWNYVKFAPGKPLPQGFGFWASAQKWWTRFMVDAVQMDSSLVSALNQRGKVSANAVPIQDKFEPFSLSFGGGGYLSYKKLFYLGAFSQIAFFTEKFPMVRDAADSTAGGITYVENPQYNLFPLTYRLGISLMPGYSYNFFYQGRDILEGTNLFWGRLSLDFPFKFRRFFDFPISPSSLNQVQLSLISNIGTVMNKSPDKIIPALKAKENQVLMDAGLRISVTFLLYHQLPFSAYFQVFQPFNSLKEKDLFHFDFPKNTLWQKERDATSTGTPLTQAQKEAALKNDRSTYLDKSVKRPRLFLGLGLGF